MRASLLRDTEAIRQEWRRRLVREWPDHEVGGDALILHDTLPRIIAGLAELIAADRQGQPAPDVSPPVSVPDEELRQFPLRAIVREYALLRETLFDHLEAHYRPLPIPARTLIDRVIDLGIEAAARTHVEGSARAARALQQERDRLTDEVAQQQRRLEAVLDQLPVGVALAECPSGKVFYHNRQAREYFGDPGRDRPPAEVPVYDPARRDGRLYPSDEYPIVRAARRGESVRGEEMRYRNVNGEYRWMSVNAAPISLGGQLPDLAVAVFWDIEEVRTLARRMAKEKEFAEITLRSISDGVITVNRAGQVIAMNPAAERLLRWTESEARMTLLAETIVMESEPDGPPKPFPVRECIDENRVIEHRPFVLLRDRQGVRRAFAVTLAPMHDEHTVIGAVIILHDASSERRMWRQMAKDASQDPLTGLVNRREFERRLKRAWHAARHDGANATLLMLDLDKFKPVNDECGHAAGDLMLREIANLIQMQVRDRDTLARVGGDEFAVILEHCPVERGLVVANSIRETVRTFEFYCEGKVFSVGVSIGVAPMDFDAPTPQEIMRRADAACYTAKESGRNRVCLARDGEVRPAVLPGQEDDSPALVESALSENRFVLYGQRIRALSLPERAENDGIEVLLRLCLSDGKLMTPDRFMPAAERYDLMPRIDIWVVENVLETLHRHPEAYDNFSICTINLSGQTLADPDAMQRIFAVLETWPLAASRLAFEIDETAALRDVASTAQAAARLRALGCRLVLQEAGVSLMSLRQLRHLPVDYLKLEQQWIREDEDADRSYALAKYVTELCHALGKQTMAVRVDDRRVLEGLQRIGVDYVQGELLEPPLNLDRLLSQHGLH